MIWGIMFKGLNRLIRWMLSRENYGVAAPRIFTSYELKLSASLLFLASVLIWSLAKNGAEEGIFGIALIGGLALYLSYVKYYRAYKPAMDRWGIRELCNPNHPRQEYRVAERDLEISADEVKLIAMQHRVKIVCHQALNNPGVQVYELKQHYEHRRYAERWNSRND